MIVWQKIEIDLVGLIVLMMLRQNLLRTNTRSRDSRLFDAMLVYGMAMLVVDSAGWLLESRHFPLARELNLVVNSLYFIGTPLTSFFWGRYCIYRVTGDERRLKRDTHIILVPMILNGVLALVNLFTPVFFNMTPSNQYAREPLFVIHAICAYTPVLYLFIMVALTMRRSASASRNSELRYLLFFPIPMVVCTVLQAIFFGTALTWIGFVLSVLLIFLNVQNQQLSSDPLTNLNNRRGMERFLDERLSTSEASLLCALMIDIDHFKSINDQYGHAAGDRALRGVADVLRRSCDKRDAFLARYGGDEFIILLQGEHFDAADEMIAAIENELSKYNSVSVEPFRISLSYGSSGFRPDEQDKREAFITRADEDMYQNKAQKTRGERAML